MAPRLCDGYCLWNADNVGLLAVPLPDVLLPSLAIQGWNKPRHYSTIEEASVISPVLLLGQWSILVLP